MSKESEPRKPKKRIFPLLCAIAVLLAVGVLIFYYQEYPENFEETNEPTPDISVSPSPPSAPAPTSTPALEPLRIKIGRSKYAYPPLHFYDEAKELVGFDIDLARAAAEIIGAEIEFVMIDWSKKDEALEDGEADVLWGGLSRSSVDDNKAAFTKPYLQSNIVLLMNEDRNYTKFEDLQGLQVCALNFTTAFDYLQAYRRDVIKPKRSFTPPEYQPILSALSSGEFDCIITDTSFAAFFCQANDAPYKISDSLLGASYVVAVRADNSELLDLLQGALDELASNGTIDQLKSKWIPTPIAPPIAEETTLA